MIWFGLLEPLGAKESSAEFIYDHQTRADMVEEWFDEDGKDHDAIFHAAMVKADLRLAKAKEEHEAEVKRISMLNVKHLVSR